jgi:hypothetical protein
MIAGTKSGPAAASLQGTSFGMPATNPSRQGVLSASAAGDIDAATSRDVDVAGIV